MKTRLWVFIFVFLIGVFFMVGRLFFWQVVKSGELADQARFQHQSGKKVLADRGNILASDGSFLAASAQTWLLFVQKSEVDLPNKTIANRLAPLIVEDTNDKAVLLEETIRIEGLLERKDLVWVPIKHKLSSEIKKNIESLKIKGVGFDPEESRFYPEASASAHLLGVSVVTGL